MKQGKRIVSLILALVMICGLMVNASAAEAQEIKAQLSYDITVNYNGEAQTLTDAAGNIVYPISYNGTTYLPVRAVSYVLGIAVDWDGATQTVLLSDGEAAAPKAVPVADAPGGSKDITAQLSPGITVKYNGEAQTMTDAAGNTVYPVSYEGTTYLPVRAVSNMLGVEVDWDGSTQTVLLSDPQKGTTVIEINGDPNTIGDNIPDDIRKMMEAMGISITPDGTITANFETSKDAKVLGENHIGYDWAEVDWSTAQDGYFRVKWNEKTTDDAMCYVKYGKVVQLWYLPFNEWAKIPLTFGNGEYQVTVNPIYGLIDENMSDEEADAMWRDELNVVINAEMDNKDAWMMMSHIGVDFENAENAKAKALEITKNCKTDAEKITAVFNYVAKTISYDYELYNMEKAAKSTGIYAEAGGESHRDYNLDHILENKKGVCEHYAVLTAGMLRSLGIPCKVACGYVKLSDGSIEGHAWVAVKPATGTLNKSALGAGMEPDGEWIRLDPTNGLKTPQTTSNDNNYVTEYYY